jgi:diguanylate cyclase (GGDEF)-like protein/PAS domain S-box-containing protein
MASPVRSAARAARGSARRSTSDVMAEGCRPQDASHPQDAAVEARYRAIVEQSHDLLMIVDGDNRLRWGNAAFERTLGYSADSLVGMSVPPLIHEDDLPALFATIGALAAEPGGSASVDFRMRAVDGSWHFMETSATNLLHEPAIRGFVVSLRDVTTRVVAEGALTTSEERYQDLIDRAHAVVYAATVEGRFTAVNTAAAGLTGYPVEELLGMTMLDLVVPEDREHAMEVLARVVAGGDETAEIQVRARDGRRLFVEVSAHLVARNGAPAHIEGVARDITERHLLEGRLRHAAIHDALTGLPNRTLLLDRLSQALGRRRDGDTQVAVMLLDIDAFKLVNGEFGHVAGDEVLVELAARFRSLLHTGETVARLGGDEFAIVADSHAARRGLAGLAERVLSAFAEPFSAGEIFRKMNASLGIAIAVVDATPAQLLRDADTAMYRVKATGGGRFAFFDASMRAHLVRQNAVRDALTTALRDGALEVHYQPVASLADNTLLAVEALIRWPHPEWGWVAPGEFVPLAEQSSLIVELGRYVLDEAARQTAVWRAHNPAALPLGVFVNVSPRELAEPTFASHVANTLGEHGLRSVDLALELTERVFLDTDDDTIIRNLERLTAMGVRLILDDFGTGYSALSSLNRFPFTALKVDRAFINTIDTPDARAPIARAVISLGESLGMAVIAEGIETDTQLDYLRNLKCGAGQGYKLARPQTAADISSLIGSAAAHRKTGRACTTPSSPAPVDRAVRPPPSVSHAIAASDAPAIGAIARGARSVTN